MSSVDPVQRHERMEELSVSTNWARPQRLRTGCPAPMVAVTATYEPDGSEGTKQSQVERGGGKGAQRQDQDNSQYYEHDHGDLTFSMSLS